MEAKELNETVERARVALANANWDASKHPRGPGGRFGKGAGGADDANAKLDKAIAGRKRVKELQALRDKRRATAEAEWKKLYDKHGGHVPPEEVKKFDASDIGKGREFSKEEQAEHDAAMKDWGDNDEEAMDAREKELAAKGGDREELLSVAKKLGIKPEAIKSKDDWDALRWVMNLGKGKNK